MSQVLLVALLGLQSYDVGRLSVYRPGDGWNSGKLACGGDFTTSQVHIAYRKWWRVGCGTRVLVCADATGRCVLAKVRDAGPYGIYRGALRRAKAEGRWRVAPRDARRTAKAPVGWKWRGVADLSWGLWLKLGRPRFLSTVHLFFYNRETLRS